MVGKYSAPHSIAIQPPKVHNGTVLANSWHTMSPRTTLVTTRNIGVAGQATVLDGAEMVPIAFGRIAQAKNGHHGQVACRRRVMVGLAHPGWVTKQS